jgi:glutathione S-transferase
VAAGGRDWESAATLVRLFRAPWSTNVERVALALAHKEVEVESVWIDYADRAPVVEASGQPLVPVLEDGGVVVADSHRILRHLEATRPEPALFPSDPAARARLDVFMEWFDQVWKVAPNAIEAELSDATPDPAEIAVQSARMDTWLDLFEDMLAGGDHLLSEVFSAADCVAFPFVKFAAGRDPADDELFHRVLDEHQSVEGRPRLAAWIERVDARPRA